jgi:hypothetical protein
VNCCNLFGAAAGGALAGASSPPREHLHPADDLLRWAAIRLLFGRPGSARDLIDRIQTLASQGRRRSATCSNSSRRRRGRHLVPDAADPRVRRFPRMDRDLRHRGPPGPAGLRTGRRRSGLARDADLREPATSVLTPPFGWSLFFLRGAAPPEVATSDIHGGAIPFVLRHILGVVAVFFVPSLATWLPKAIGW